MTCAALTTETLRSQRLRAAKKQAFIICTYSKNRHSSVSCAGFYFHAVISNYDIFILRTFGISKIFEIFGIFGIFEIFGIFMISEIQRNYADFSSFPTNNFLITRSVPTVSTAPMMIHITALRMNPAKINVTKLIAATVIA